MARACRECQRANAAPDAGGGARQGGQAAAKKARRREHIEPRAMDLLKL